MYTYICIYKPGESTKRARKINGTQVPNQINYSSPLLCYLFFWSPQFSFSCIYNVSKEKKKKKNFENKKAFNKKVEKKVYYN